MASNPTATSDPSVTGTAAVSLATSTDYATIMADNEHDISLVPPVIVGFILCTIFFSLRIHVRRTMVKHVGLDDYVLMAAFVVFVALSALFMVEAIEIKMYGAVDEVVTILAIGQFWLFFSMVLTVLLRCAIATFLLRLIPKQHYYRIHRIVIKATISIFAVYVLVAAFIILFQCGTTLGEIDGTSENPTVCINTPSLVHIGTSIMALTTISDWLMVIIPMGVVFRSAMPFQAKFTTLMVIALGAVAGIVAIIRIPYNDLADVYGPQSFHNYLIWQVLALYENSIGIMAISLAALKPLLSKMGLFSQSGSTSNQEMGAQPVDISDKEGGNVVFLTEFQVKPEDA